MRRDVATCLEGFEGSDAMNPVCGVCGWRLIVPWLVIGCCLLPVQAVAAPITVAWDVVPHEDGELEATPFYYCTGDRWADRRCRYLWEQGMELYAVDFSFYDDKWFDGYGFGDTSLSNTVMGMRPRCEPALAPCFDTFTPRRLVLSGYENLGPDPNLFVVTSLGRVVKLRSVQGTVVVDFSPSQRPIQWLEIGFYLPARCDEPGSEFDQACNPSTEKALVVEGLTFEPFPEAVPEPALTVLLATGVAGLIRRRHARRST
jgi:hypothetical protein